MESVGGLVFGGYFRRFFLRDEVVVEHHHGAVVAAAGLESGIHQWLGGVDAVLVGDGFDGVVVDHIAEAVGANYEKVAVLQG